MNLKLKKAAANARTKASRYFADLKTKERKGIIENSTLLAFRLYKKVKTAIHKTDNRMAAKVYLRSRKLLQDLNGEKFRFVSLDESVVWTTEWIKSFPKTYDIVIGIPRSGMLIAGIVSLKLGKPLTTPELFHEGRYWMSGKVKDKPGLHAVRSILLIDDSVDNGSSMRKAIKQIFAVNDKLEITKAALITTKASKSLVDLSYCVVPHPRLFEWNIMHRKIASYSESRKVGFDIDGVLCENCPPNVDDSEESYVDWIRNAKPYLIPNYNIDVIISSRLEKYRKETEEWLIRHGVKYSELVLWGVPSKEHRDSRFAQYKAEQLLRHKPDMFFESHLGQSQYIWKTTKIPTLCVDEMVLFS